MMPVGNSLLLKFKNFVTDLIFPKRCIECGRHGGFLCNDCALLLKPLSIAECPVCRQSSFGGRTCQRCVSKSSLDFLWVLSDYNNQLIKNIICQIKYSFVTELVPALDDLISQYFDNLRFEFKNILFVPVPLHRRRLLERGFNQAELIGERIMGLSGGAMDSDLMVRIKYSFPQAKLSAKERSINLAGYFAVNTERSAFYDKQRIVILVDDVYTTGSTMQECARLLKNAGFNNVGGMVLARGSRG